MRQRALWKEAVEEALSAVRDAGVEVVTPDRAPFAERVAPMFEAFRGDSELYDLIQRIRA